MKIGFGERKFRPLSDISPDMGAPYAVDALPELRAPLLLPGNPAIVGRPHSAGGDSLAPLRDVFTPTQPKLLGPHFIGRGRYLSRLISAVEQERTHIVLFGDRGRGKTSLANAFADMLGEAGHLVVRQSCSAATTFEDLFRTILASIPMHLLSTGNRGALHSPADLLPPGPFGAQALIAALEKIESRQSVFIIDEFDRITSDDVRNAITETIKGLSDVRAPVTLLLVGVSASLEDLLGRHPSVERNVLGLHLVRMRSEEIGQLIETGAKAAGLTFSEAVSEAIQRCCRGMPYYAHLLCLLSGSAASRRGVAEVELEDLAVAIDDVLLKQEQEVGAVYDDVCLSKPGRESLLFRAALAETDDHDRFDAAAVLAVADPDRKGPPIPSSEVEQALIDLSAMQAAPFRKHPSPGRLRFSFVQASLAHYVLLRRVAEAMQVEQRCPSHA
jgi:hypothetical protein